MNIQTLKASSAVVILGFLTCVPGGAAHAQQANSPGIQYVIRSDGITQTYAAISIDQNVSTYVPMQPGDISYADGDGLVSPGLSYVPPVVSSEPSILPPTLSEIAAQPAAPAPVDGIVAISPEPVMPADALPVQDTSLAMPMGEMVVPVDARTDAVVRGNECVGQSLPTVRSGALNIMMGDLLSDQIGNWARERGYTVYWEADQYRAGGALTLNKDFEETLRVVRESLQQSGIDLTMTIYSNCVVRVTEAK